MFSEPQREFQSGPASLTGAVNSVDVVTVAAPPVAGGLAEVLQLPFRIAKKGGAYFAPKDLPTLMKVAFFVTMGTRPRCQRLTE